MAATVTIDKVYFETLLRRAEFVRHLCKADWLLERSLFIVIAYIWQRSDNSR